MVRILVVGAIRLYRDGLTLALGRQEGLEVIASLADPGEMDAAVPALHPDVVLIDMASPDSHSAVSRLCRDAPDTLVVALGVAEVEADVLRCAEAGVSAYVSREGSLESLVEAIQGAVRGELQCTPRIAGTMLRRLGRMSPRWRGDDGTGTLTARELEVVGLIDSGCSNKEIAIRLGIEVATVKNHVHNLLDKLRVHRRGHAAAKVRHLYPHQRI
jgi:DNA-binding NarL/FixJ family response regulator